MSEKTSIGLYIDKSVIQDIDSVLDKTNCLSRNEFITEAIRRYITFLKRKDYSDTFNKIPNRINALQAQPSFE